jgi:outer membrane protein
MAFLVSILGFFAHAQAEADGQAADLPKWEVGLGVGALRYEHYPAANQFTEVALPFPTFTYRGDVLRADDRGGAKVFLLQQPTLRLQLGGVAFPPLHSSTNTARDGMDDLPLLVGVGPQVVKEITEELTFKVGVYQALAAEFISLKTSGAIGELDLTYRKKFDLRGSDAIFGIDETTSSVSIGLMAASKEVTELYYDVPKEKATSTRTTFDANPGVLQSQINYFQSVQRGNLAFYLGLRVADYTLSSNRESALYRSDQLFTGLAGITYTFYKSKTRGVDEDDATGFVNRRK